MQKLLGKLICAIKGHRRGKRVPNNPLGEYYMGQLKYQCPRCGATWSRKVKAKVTA